ncbi:hypothetical protein G1L02_06470 [Tenacibaculum finnmarkense]|uniref:DUF6702 family protein n=1 Tax=Tenacibaculum finnmarkense TaxID=2781243 RepID=UPI001EFB9D50|nr:DUF6702 family protein [Tenacibaculum finnmarkense]MCG8236408.1 hypothetical protein [Tenacibaculum finnmarkense genomovar ulcerans]MCG8733714.1 hypothetical protein [Tenacibaculum finnmarkense]MCG8795477.1 hypothetical protein [Tenacibaculum finnmarkense]MCG8797745.1 hypothetical protein [Tenacibaculum finnmarkense]MCG8812820.1 hypothetical protein [Tenacibaculum finnmarkense]
MNKNIIKISLLFFILPLLAFSLHKYYISLTEISYQEETKSVQMIMNVFMDDIETAINKEYNVDLQLTSNKELKNVDSLFIKYLEKNFKIKINQKQVAYHFIGKEYDGDIIYFYLEIENIASLKTIEIENNMLIKYFAEQQNLVKASVKKERKSLFLDKKNNTGLLKF